MALITLRRNLCHLSDFRIHGALAALKHQPVNHVHKAVKEHLCPWFCSLQPGPFRVRFHHAYCKKFHSENGNDLHPFVNFMAKIFSPYFLQQLQGEESHLDRLSLAQLTQLMLTSLLECPFYKGPKRLPKYQVKSFLTPCCSLETPVDFQLYKSVMMGLIDLLGARLYFASKVLTPYYYTIDVEIKLDEEGFVLPFTFDEDVHKRIALCIDGPKRFCLNSKHLLGKEAIKQRHLRLLGYQVVQIPYYEVETLQSRFELVEYLQRKLFSETPDVRW
ncbi:FAST kinase domain-containing protein 3, mitochondrial isoform X2 [Phyllostomus hastatus]|uniref:FAST kinase domain-containing protein 3, mitochondrial isoform X2 n=1 Tax=Phyllostomus hastatus TaxID=9423 RepID=UPI001E68357B|nr:FAST kinase domain-containing protein 3, mitochondrial isoform X2 [Phyllostomus hastatus]